MVDGVSVSSPEQVSHPRRCLAGQRRALYSVWDASGVELRREVHNLIMCIAEDRGAVLSLERWQNEIVVEVSEVGALFQEATQ
jgi:hypothetical protein